MAGDNKDVTIDEFIRKYGEKMTVLEISQHLNISRYRVYKHAALLGIKPKAAQMGRPPHVGGKKNTTICAFRPYSCFNCPNEDCICTESRTEEESDFAFIGLGSDTNNAKYRRYKKGKKNDKPKT